MNVTVIKGCIKYGGTYYKKGASFDMLDEVAQPLLGTLLIADESTEEVIVAVTKAAYTPVSTLPSVTEEIAATLNEAGIESVEVLCEMSEEDLTQLKRIGTKKAEKLLKEAYQALGLS